MARQYIRNVEATINNVVVRSDGDTGLRIQFATKQWTSSTPATCNIIITNPAPQTIAAMRKERAPVTLKAGYVDGGMGVIFQGEVLQVRNGRESISDTFVHILATHKDAARNYATVNKALASGHTYNDRLNVALDAFKAMGVERGFIDQISTRKFPRNFVAHGMAADLMREIARANDANWFIHDNKLNLLKANNTLPGSTHVINADTGMVWLPEQTIQGVNVRCLLNYNINPGDKVQLNNASIQQAAFNPSNTGGLTNFQLQQGILALAADGIYKVWVVEHEGDTRGNKYETMLICSGTPQPAPALTAAGYIGNTTDVPSDVDQQGGQ